MYQFILHLFGDFVLQNDWMAANKRTNAVACFVHCLMYSICFIVLCSNMYQWAFIFITHFVIDHFGLAANWCNYYKVGARLPQGDWLKLFLIFMVDMAMHLFCNHIALLYL